MEKYEKLQSTTRDYEQRYTVYKIAQLSNKIRSLRRELGSKSSESEKLAGLREQVASLERMLEETQKSKLRLENELNEEKMKSREPSREGVVQKGKSMEKELTNIAITEQCIKDIKENQLETKKLLKQISKSIEDKVSVGGASFLKKRIRDLEEEVENLREKNIQLEKNAKLLTEQKSSIALMRDSIEVKDKAIQAQKSAIDRLNEQLSGARKAENPFGNEVVIPESSKKEAMGGLATPWSVNVPVEQPAPKKKGKGKNVNVESIFKEENKGFFNNLSFSNSSPMMTKKFKKTFK